LGTRFREGGDSVFVEGTRGNGDSPGESRGRGGVFLEKKRRRAIEGLRKRVGGDSSSQRSDGRARSQRGRGFREKGGRKKIEHGQDFFLEGAAC